MWHHWLTTDDDPDRARPLDQCLFCGVVTPEFGEGVLSDHGPLPIMCPGPDGTGPWPAHHFDPAGNDSIECVHCGVTIDGDTLPADVDWRCNPSGLWHCPEHPESTPDHVDTDGTTLWSCGGVDETCVPAIVRRPPQDEWVVEHYGRTNLFVVTPF